MKTKEAPAGLLVATNVRILPAQRHWLRVKAMSPAYANKRGDARLDVSAVLRDVLAAAMAADRSAS